MESVGSDHYLSVSEICKQEGACALGSLHTGQKCQIRQFSFPPDGQVRVWALCGDHQERHKNVDCSKVTVKQLPCSRASHTF